MKKNKADFIESLCYILLVVVATLLVFTKILPGFGIKFSGKFWLKTFSILQTIQDVSFVALACVGAFAFAKKQSKIWLTIYIIAVVICILSIVVRLF